MFNSQEAQRALFDAFLYGQLLGSIVVLIRVLVLSVVDRKTP